MRFILPQKQQSQIRKIRKLNSQLPYQQPQMQMQSACKPMKSSKVDVGLEDGLVRSILGSCRLSKSMARNGRKSSSMCELGQVLKQEVTPKNFLLNSRKSSKPWSSFWKTWTCTTYWSQWLTMTQTTMTRCQRCQTSTQRLIPSNSNNQCKTSLSRVITQRTRRPLTRLLAHSRRPTTTAFQILTYLIRMTLRSRQRLQDLPVKASPSQKSTREIALKMFRWHPQLDQLKDIFEIWPNNLHSK